MAGALLPQFIHEQFGRQRRFLLKQLEQRIFDFRGRGGSSAFGRRVLETFWFDEQFRQHVAGTHQAVDEFFYVVALFGSGLRECNTHPNFRVHQAYYAFDPQFKVAGFHGENDASTGRKWR